MSRDDIHKLLGGYATGTLTPEEQQALFEAALDDQELFDMLAREQPVHDLLRDPAARAHLLAALGERRLAWHERVERWVWGHAVGLAAVACFLVVAGYVAWQARDTGKPKLLVEMTQPTTIEVRSSEPAAPAQPQSRRAFNPETAKKAVPGPAPELPPPPAVREFAAGPPGPPQFLHDLPAAPPKPATAAAPPPRDLAVSEFRVGSRGGGAVGGVLGGVLPSRSENVTVTAEAAPVLQTAAAGGARALYYMDKAADSATRSVAGFAGQQGGPAPHLGLRYKILRKLPGGGFEQLPSGQDLAAGDTVKLEFEPNDAGFLTVMESGAGQASRPLLAATRVQQFASVETPEIKVDGAGAREYLVTFARQAQTVRPNLIRTTSALRSETNAGERTTYVVNAGGDPRSPVPFTIKLNWK